MKPRPHILLETLVEWLLPPDCREHVVGDLSERYQSPGQYVFDALRTLPMVIASQVRRRWDGIFIAIEVCAFLAAFESAWRFANLPLLSKLSQLPPLAIAVMAGLMGMVLQDVYVPRQRRHPLHAVLNVAAGIACIFVVEVVAKSVAPQFALPWRVVLDGSLIAAAILAVAHSVLWTAMRSNPDLLPKTQMTRFRNVFRWATPLFLLIPFGRVVLRASGTGPRIWAGLLIAVTTYMAFKRYERPSSGLQDGLVQQLETLRKSSKFVWIIGALVAFGIFVNPVPELARIEVRFMGATVGALACLFVEKGLRLRAACIQERIEAMGRSKTQRFS